ncbi:hypothetical protein N7G274_009122 [Stereocaulon virgatum]|uniref:Mitochondrial outer membrane protein n=1 Tax=Stereocaulon virgatum TaxID=373712 RepID=A0ABR3ZWY9_9LECA
MSQDADATPEEKQKPRAKAQIKHSSWSWFATPQPIKHLFDKFPLEIYSENELPQRTAYERDPHALYVFTTNDGARAGAPSFNPGCLKWQAYLKFRNFPFITKSSNNHASPTGALPFLLPASSSSTSVEAPPSPVPSNRIQRWTRDVREKRIADSKSSNLGNKEAKQGEAQPETRASTEEATASSDIWDIRYEAYMSLLDHRIRNAYLYSLYLSPPNFDAIAFPLYIAPSTTNTLVRITISHQLRAAAEAELLKQSSRIDVEAIYQESEKAFAALSDLLGDDEYYFKEKKPGLFDASVFAYTNLLLDKGLGWRDTRMVNGLRCHPNLVAHQKKLKKAYF